MRWCDKETVESGFHFPSTYLKSVEIPSKSNCVSSRPEIKAGLIYYLISKYTVSSKWKERSIDQFQKATSSFLIKGTWCEFFVLLGLCNYMNGLEMLCNFLLNCQILTKWNLLRLFVKFFTLCKCQSIRICAGRAINQLDSGNMNESKFNWHALVFLK